VTQYWCLHCERAFSAEEPQAECPYDDCDGHAYDLERVSQDNTMFFPWPDHWPATLVDGERYPLY